VNNSAIQNEKAQNGKNTQKWYINNEKRKKRNKTRTVVPIKMVSVIVVHDINNIGDKDHGTGRQYQFEDYDNDDDGEASVSTNFSNTAACCGDTSETYYV
jgi:hypothetical protein